jgi:hypothetical protein
MPVYGQKSILQAGESLHTGEFLVSLNRSYFAVMQPDANFCVYRGSGPADNRGFVWCSMKTAPGGQFRAAMQTDGNFVVYPEGSTSAVWATMSMAPGGQFIAVMQDDGNFAVYPGTSVPTATSATAIGPLWNSGTGERVFTISPPPLGAITASTGAVCPPACSLPVRYGTPVTLTANAQAPHRFVSWTGACEAATSATCTLQSSPTTPAAIAANIEERVTLSVVVPPGSQIYSENHNPILCGDSYVQCTATLAKGSSHRLSTYSRYGTGEWIGDCSGSNNDCVLTLDTNKVVGVQVPSHVLTGSPSTGGKLVTSASYEFMCPDKCASRYGAAQDVKIWAMPEPGYAFVRWTGDCARATAVVTGNECVLKMSGDRVVAAEFRRQ